MYNHQFRRQALAKKFKDLHWSVTDPQLYNEALMGRPCSIAHCTFCLQDDHSAAYCLHNPHRPYFGWFPDPTSWLAFTPLNPPISARGSKRGGGGGANRTDANTGKHAAHATQPLLLEITKLLQLTPTKS